MGLLGDENMLNQARQQGLLGLAAGLLQAGGPSRTRTNIGQAIGSGLMAGQQMYQQATNQQIQQAGAMQKLQEAQRQRQQQDLVRQVMPQLIQQGAPTVEGMQFPVTRDDEGNQLPGVMPGANQINQVALNTLRGALDPDQFKKVMESIKIQFEVQQPKEEKSPFAAIDPSKYTPESIAQFSRTKNYSVLRPTETEQFTGEYANIARAQFGTPNLSQLTPEQRVAIGQAAMQSAASQAPQINMPTENAILNRVVVPRIASLNEEAASARNIAQASETINNLLKGTGGGGLVKLTADAQRFLGVRSDTASRDDLAQALATQTAVGVRATGSGATSDLEFKAYLAAVPSLSRTEDGRQFMADYARRRARRAAQLADYAQKLAVDNRYSEIALQDYDEKLGALLTEDERGRFLPQPVARPAAGGIARQQGWVRD
jgi:hypothetical protein